MKRFLPQTCLFLGFVLNLSDAISTRYENAGVHPVVSVALLAVPSPVRALRKHLENHRRTTVDVRNSCFGRHFSLVRSCCTQYVVSLLSQSELTALPSHRTDYLRFGILVI